MLLHENPRGILLAKSPKHVVLCAALLEGHEIIALYLGVFQIVGVLSCYVVLMWCVLLHCTPPTEVIFRPTNFIISIKEETAILLFVFFLENQLWSTKILYLLYTSFSGIVHFYITIMIHNELNNL